MYKRGQLTAFIIVGLVLIVLFGLFFSMRDIGIENTVADFTAIENGIQSCSDFAASTAVKYVLASGGQLDPDEYYYTQYGKVPFLNNMHTIDINFVIEYIEELYLLNFNACLLNFEIEYDDIEINIKSVRDKTIFDIKTKFEVRNGFSTKVFDGLQSDVNIELDNIVRVANIILNATTPDTIPLSIMLDESDTTGYKIEAVEIDDFVVYWISSEPYVLLFAVQGDRSA